jgi:hypothetical protein
MESNHVARVHEEKNTKKDKNEKRQRIELPE